MATIESIHERCVRTEEGCLLWLGSITTDTGYSKISHEAEVWLGHRLVFTLAHRDLEPGEHVDHACHNGNSRCVGTKNCLHRRCLEPSHLEAVTQLENNRRARTMVTVVKAPRTNAERGTCKKGLHPWIPENIGTVNNGEICKPCRRINQRIYDRRKAAKEGRTVSIRMTSRKS